MQIAIMVYPGMTALDAIGPYEVLRQLEGAEIRFVWKEVGPVITDSGVLLLGATHTFAETSRPDLLLVPGSTADTAVMMADPSVMSWLKEAHPNTRFTTSVCSGSLILAAAGLLEGCPATSHWAALSSLGQFGAQARPDDRVVQHGKILTAAGVSAGIDLALTLVAAIDGEQRARMIQLIIEYDPQPPFDSGHTSKASQQLQRIARRSMTREAITLRGLKATSQVLVKRWREVLLRRVRGVV